MDNRSHIYGIEIDHSRDSIMDDFAKTLLTKYYLLKDESIQEGFARAAAGSSGGDMELAQKIYDYVSKGYFMFSSPILSNAPTPGNPWKALPISCFLNYVDDSLEGLIDHTSELRWLSVKGGGVGGHWSDVRAISDKAPGPIPFLKTVDSDMNAFKQGSTRKGSYAAYLDISHPDIVEFINFRDPTGGDPNRKCFNLHNAVNITDDFMKAVTKGEMWDLKDPDTGEVRDSVKARHLMQRLIETRFKTGEPYLNFIDTANKHLPESLKALGLKINGSNLCFTGDQRVVTHHGLLTAKELFDMGGDLIVFDNNNYQKSSPMSLVEKDASVFKITLKNGMTHKVTGYHKVKTSRGDVRCDNLSPGDKVFIQTNKGSFGSGSFENEAFLLGLYQADGIQDDDLAMIELKENILDLREEVQECLRILNKSDLEFKKGSVPSWIWSANEKTQWQYIRGLFYANGSVSISNSKGKPMQLSLVSANKELLSDVMLVTRNLGMSSSIYSLRNGTETSLPNKKKDTWRLVIGNKNDALVFDKNTGFLKRKNFYVKDRRYRNDSKKVSEVTSIEFVGREDVYCINVDSEEHHFVCNGFITHNCNEIHLPTSKDRTAVCCLSSLNLERYDEWKDLDVVETLIRMLDNILDVFTDNAPSVLSKAIYSATRERSLGLGAMGFHAYLQKHNIPWESAIATSVNHRIFSDINEKAVKASIELAKERGVYPDAGGLDNKRNSHLLAIAPNANSSIIACTSSSIEPRKSNAYTHRTRAGSFLVKNPYLNKIVEERVPESERDAVWSSIITNAGSVQHVDFLDDHEKAVFKTAFEIDQQWVVQHAADRQKYICQGQSVNLFFPSGSNKSYVMKVHIQAWKQGLKGLYYLRTSSSVDPDKVSHKMERASLADYAASEQEECLACHG